MAFSGEGASKPFLTSGCPFISFFLSPLWSDTESPDLGLPAITLFKNNPQETRLPGLPQWMRFSIEYHFVQIQGFPRRKQQIEILERFRQKVTFHTVSF